MAYIQLDDIFRRYAYQILLNRVNWFQKMLMNEDDYVCEVDWSYLTLDHKVVKFAPSQEEGEVMETNWGNVMSGSRWVSLWSCDFDNKADGKQSHTFRGSRDTTTWVDVELNNYYTIDKEPNININLPPSFTKVRAGRDNTLNVNKVKGQIFKELLTWEVNSQVEVVPGWKAHAELLAKEESYNIKFEIRTTILNPKGVVPVYFKRKTDGKVRFLVNVYDYQGAFKSEDDGGVIKEEEKPFVEFKTEVTETDGEETEEKCFPQIISQGSLDCLCWSDQKVDIKTAPLGQENNSDGDRNSVSSLDRNSILSNRDSSGLNYNSSYTERKVIRKTVVQ